MGEISEIKKALQRERAARKEAERVIELKSRDLYEKDLELNALIEEKQRTLEHALGDINDRQQELNILFEMHPHPIIIYELGSGKIMNLNSKACSFYGYSKLEIRGKSITILHPRNEKEVVEKHIKKLKVGTTTGEWKQRLKNGDTVNVKITGSALNYKSLQCRMIIVEDLTERDELISNNQQERQRYTKLVEKSSEVIFEIDNNGIFKYVNPVGCKISGYSQKELYKMAFAELIEPSYHDRVLSFYHFQLESMEQSTYTEFPIRTKSGETKWLGQNVEISEVEDGKVKSLIAFAREITEKKIFEKALLRSEEKYRSIIENMNLGLLELDRDGVIQKAYPTFCNIVGYTPQELEGTKGLFMLDEEGIEIMNREQSDRLEGVPGAYEIQLIAKSGEKKWLMISGAPFYDEKNKMIGSVGIHLDITDQKKLQRELYEAKEAAENLLQTKEMFLANISHEIRTPLNAIIGIGELFNETDLNDVQSRYLSSITSASRNLLGIINDLLLLAQNQAGQIKLMKEPTNVERISLDTFDFLKPQAEKKGLDFELRFNGNFEIYELDKLRLSQILQNLLSNAIKFTNKGKVLLEVNNLGSEGEKDTLQFRVVDTGIGIPTHEQSKIFEHFTQASNNNIHENGGTGLGLSIVKSLVDLCHGEVSFLSGDNGTEFSVKVAAKRVHENSIQESIKSVAPHNLNGKHILVAEDNEVNQFLIKNILIKTGCEFDIVNNGVEAIEALNGKSYDVLLLDIRMPVMDGVEAAKQIRSDKRFDDLVIIALTANDVNENREQYLEVGMNDLVSKPFTQQSLFEVLNKYISKSETADPKDAIVSRLRRFSNGDSEFEATLLRIFKEDTQKRVKDLQFFKDHGEYDRIKDVCHSMKPSLNQVAGDELYNLAKSIELDELSLNDFVKKVNQLVIKLEELVVII